MIEFLEKAVVFIHSYHKLHLDNFYVKSILDILGLQKLILNICCSFGVAEF